MHGWDTEIWKRLAILKDQITMEMPNLTVTKDREWLDKGLTHKLELK